MLIIAAPEKPFDSAEADAIYDFVTEKGGKVIIASNSTNAQTVADKFDVKYWDAPAIDPDRYYEVADVKTDESYPDDKRKLWAVAGGTRFGLTNSKQGHIAATVICKTAKNTMIVLFLFFSTDLQEFKSWRMIQIEM